LAKVVKSLSKNVKKLSKISQKFIQKCVKNVSQKFVNNLPFCSDCPGRRRRRRLVAPRPVADFVAPGKKN
jgi:hypothetical protein